MFLHFLKCVAAATSAAICLAATDGRILRVCADPNNLPFSNQAEEGFENRLAHIVADGLGARLEYTWWPERRSFLKNSLNQGRCDAVMGVPSSIDQATTTAPYYRSTYVTVVRRDRALKIASLLDPALDNCRIGIHITGNDYAPPAQVLARRGLSAHIVGFSLSGVDGEKNSPLRLVDAVRSGAVDVAIVWGPFAGYFASRGQQPLDIQPVLPSSFQGVPFSYDISIGVRKGDTPLRDEINKVLERQRAAIRSLLQEYGIPLVDGER